MKTTAFLLFSNSQLVSLEYFQNGLYHTMNNAHVAGEIYSRINNVIEKELR
ncbi:MAG: hypothetical protein J5642_05155 [Bacteroidales bacterium]|nr:hypothetical protein [Bacteroidales bacterium]